MLLCLIIFLRRTIVVTWSLRKASVSRSCATSTMSCLSLFQLSTSAFSSYDLFSSIRRFFARLCISFCGVRILWFCTLPCLDFYFSGCTDVNNARWRLFGRFWGKKKMYEEFYLCVCSLCCGSWLAFGSWFDIICKLVSVILFGTVRVCCYFMTSHDEFFLRQLS